MSFILIAEDDPAIREGLEAALQSDGHETRAAANGVEALARIAERRPDLLLLDVMMPGKSGWDVCAGLRRRAPRRAAPRRGNGRGITGPAPRRVRPARTRRSAEKFTLA